MVIRRKEEYVVDGLGRVSVYTAVDSKLAQDNKEPQQIFEGFAVLGAQTPQGIMQVPCEFRLEKANTLDEAFQQFQAAATERFKIMMEEARKQAEAQQNRIITAPAGSIPNMKLVTD